MLHRFGTAALIALAGCTMPPSADSAVLRVTLNESYFWPDTFTPRGGTVQVDVFPLVTALVVDSRDGRSLGPADEAASRAAARAYCKAQDGQLSATAGGRLNEGTWAFPTCQMQPI